MTSASESQSAATEPFAGLEVATVAGDALRASIRVSGSLGAATVTLLTSVLRTHMTAGRRYLRVDLGEAEIADGAVVQALVDSHLAVERLGGMLVFENAGERIVDAVQSASLYIRVADG